MSDALDVLMVIAARVLTVLLGVFATGRDAAHATAWAFAVTGDVISAGEPGGHMSVEKITDDGDLASEKRGAPNDDQWPPSRPMLVGFATNDQ